MIILGTIVLILIDALMVLVGTRRYIEHKKLQYEHERTMAMIQSGVPKELAEAWEEVENLASK